MGTGLRRDIIIPFSPQAQSQPPALVSWVSSAWAHAWPAPSEPHEKQGLYFPRQRHWSKGQHRGSSGGSAACSWSPVRGRSLLCPGTDWGTHPLQELRPLLLLVTTSCCCYFVFLPAPFPPLFFLIQLQEDRETQIRASRCGLGQEVGVNT